MPKPISPNFLLGNVVALAYSLKFLVMQQSNSDKMFAEITELLNGLSESLLKANNVDAADGVERMRMVFSDDLQLPLDS